MGLSVIMRITLRDGTFHEVGLQSKLLPLDAQCAIGYWLRTNRKLQRQGHCL